MELGADADLAIWDPERETVVTRNLLHDKVGFTPYELMNPLISAGTHNGQIS